jgi:serine/threonine protein kinase
MPLPVINAAGVKILVPSADNIEEIGSGGQKVVFKAQIGAEFYALKFLFLCRDVGGDEDEIARVRARADREVAIMRECNSSHMVKLGPVGLEVGRLNDQRLLYYSEELISGSDLSAVIPNRIFECNETIDLGLQIGDAITELWKLGKVHRDIKPGNIMCRPNGSFVLLDAGLAFDITGESLSIGLIVGTFAYCSPEQFDYSSRRGFDFRTDQYSLAVTMYYACTGRHPFMRAGMTQSMVYSGIMGHQPPAPSSINPSLPAELDAIILKALGKSPHLRFRKMEQFIQSLKALKG